MELLIGVLIGISVSAILIATTIFLGKITIPALEQRPPPVRKDDVLGKGISTTQKGFIIEPESEADEARSEIIERNNELGIDTPLTDLEYEDT